MRARMKFIATIAAFVIAIGAAVGITYGVMAAHNATVTTPINIGYTSQEVAARLSATYQVQGGAVTNFLTGVSDDNTTADIDESTTLRFTGEETGTNNDNVKAFVAPNPQPTLTSTNKTITFVFTITNDTGAEITATVTMPATQTNVTITKTGDSNSIDVAANATATYTVTVTITNVAKDASFTGDFSWNLARKVVTP